MTLTLKNSVGLAMGLMTVLGAVSLPACESETVTDVTERSLQGNENMFELDGNAEVNNGWETDWAALASLPGPTVFIADPAPASILVGPGSRDTIDLEYWRHQDGAVFESKDITNAYAAASFNLNNELIIYFGADRYANWGAAHLGFWLFQEQVTPMANGTFTGAHQAGDVLILADFSNDGFLTDMRIFEWGVGDTLDLLFESSVDCSSVVVTKACVITNQTAQESPWDYGSTHPLKDGPFPEFTFFEGGVNISALFEGQELPCFATFMAEMRSSMDEDATLADFAIGSFPLCEPDPGGGGETTSGDGGGGTEEECDDDDYDDDDDDDDDDKKKKKE
jgi:hypothetical protein